MTDRPILFSAPMVRALLDGRKSQTRRIIKDAPSEAGWICYVEATGTRKWIGPNGYPSMPCTMRFAKGDRLWVREAWAYHGGDEMLYQREPGAVGYRADVETDPRLSFGNVPGGRWRVSIHMPRWASRLTLTVTDVGVERLQAINEQEAIAEGIAWQMIRRPDGSSRARWFGVPHVGRDLDPVRAYADLWDSINGVGSWDANPWVIARTFSVEKRNIDQC